MSPGMESKARCHMLTITQAWEQITTAVQQDTGLLQDEGTIQTMNLTNTTQVEEVNKQWSQPKLVLGLPTLFYGHCL